MTTNRHFCEVFFDDVRVPAANLVGQPRAARSSRRCASSSTSGAASTGCCRTTRCTSTPKPQADTSRPARAPGDRPPRDRLPARAAAGAARDARAGAAGRSRPRPRRSAPSTSSASPTSPPARSAPTPLLWGRMRPRRLLLPGLHDHGRHLERAAQHHRRARPGPPPRTLVAHLMRDPRRKGASRVSPCARPRSDGRCSLPAATLRRRSEPAQRDGVGEGPAGATWMRASSAHAPAARRGPG